MDFESLTFDIDGVHTAVKAIGKGPAVLAAPPRISPACRTWSSQAKIWAERIPKAKVHIIPGVGHIAMQEDPKTVTLIGDFLAGK